MQRKIKSDIERVARRYREMNWDCKEVYADYLAQTYHYVAYSTRLLAYAAGNMKLEDDVFFKRFITHITEESSHEKLAKRDLKNLGYQLEDYSELPETACFYETQFYKIQHVDPLSFMGYVLLLESVALTECPPLTEKVNELYGNKCLSFIKLHGEEDPDHVEKALQVLDELPKERVEALTQNLHQSANTFIAILDAIEERQLSNQLRKSA